MGTKWKTTEVAVGIVGPSWSGKTVMLASLINHLESHDPRHFSFGKPGTTLSRFRPEARADEGWALFPYREFRNRLVHGRWPEKTRDRYQYVCRFERSDWKYSDVLLKLYDLPGERINDVSMVRRDFHTYEHWSDHVIQQIRDDVARVESFDVFLKRADDPTDESAVMGAYRLGLARLWLSYKHFLTPSTFLLDLEGKTPRGRDPEQVAGERFAGLSKGEEFAPLPTAARARNPALAERFRNRFERYRDWIVAPWVRTLKSCHGLVILVDVLEVLASGRPVYNDHRQFLEELFIAINPANNFFDDLLSKLYHALLPHQLRRSWVSRVAFVASKLDRVHPDDRKRVGHLLEQMVKKFRGDLTAAGIATDLFRVAAVRSTEQAPQIAGTRQLLGRTMRDERGARITEPGEKRVFSVSAVPDTWPNDWREGEYYFPEVFPYIPPRLDAAPEQEGLDKVIEFLCR